MGKIRTIIGDVDSSEMGFTDIHTHIRFKLPDDFRWSDETDRESLPFKLENIHDLKRGYWAYSEETYELCDRNTIFSELGEFSKAGGKTIVEGSPVGCRTNLELVHDLATELNLNIILSSGFYAKGLWPKEYESYTVPQLIDFLEDEVENGLDGTSYLPGQMKMACNIFDDIEKRGLLATAYVAGNVKLPYQVHTGGSLSPDITLKMIDYVKKEGVNLEKTIFLHMDQFVKNCNLKDFIIDHDNAAKLNLDGVRRVLDTGAIISFDCIGNNEDLETKYYVKPNDYDRVAALYQLIEEGYSKQIVIGSDVFQQLYYRKYGGSGYMRQIEFTIPALKEVGVSDQIIEDITINNPARIYSI